MWSPCIVRSKASGQGNISNSKAHTAYILREPECITWAMKSASGAIYTPQEAQERWEDIGYMETGLLPLDAHGRGQRNGVIQERYVVPLPNQLTEDFDQGMMTSICSLVARQIAGDSLEYIWSLHRGEKGDSQNLHMHIDVRPRGPRGKTSRNMAELRAHTRYLRRKVGDLLQELGYEVEPVEDSIQRGSGEHVGPAVFSMANRGIQGDVVSVAEKIEKYQQIQKSKQDIKTSMKILIHEGWKTRNIVRTIENAGFRIFQEGHRKTWKLGDGNISLVIRRILKIPEVEIGRQIQIEREISYMDMKISR